MVRVYPTYELPPEDVYVVEKMGYNLRDYSYIAVGMHPSGWEDLCRLFGDSYIVTPKPDYDDEPAVFHYALIEPK
jgi:hypothetical protein